MLSLFIEKILGGIIGLLFLFLNGIGAILFLCLCYTIFCIIVTRIQIICLKYWGFNPIYSLKQIYHKYCD